MAGTPGIAARHARPQRGRSRLRLWLVLSLGARARSEEGSGPRRVREDAGAGIASAPDPAIAYARADLERLDLPAAAFDLAYSSLAFHYIEDLAGLLASVQRAPVPGAHLVFSIEHPIYMAPTHPGWAIDAQGRKTWPIDSYQVEGPRTTNWLANGVVKHHRTIGNLLNGLIRAGFTLTHVEEWGPADEQIAARPELAEEGERPMMLLVAAHR